MATPRPPDPHDAIRDRAWAALWARLLRPVPASPPPNPEPTDDEPRADEAAD
jgi:hypothetical protein